MDKKLVDAACEAMETCTGGRPGYRRAHPRGLVCNATFESAPDLKAFTVAEHLQGGTVSALVRFSNASGSPFAPDRNSPTNGKVMGLGIRFALPSGGVASWASANIPAFIARIPSEFVTVTRAQKPSFRGKPSIIKGLLYFLPRKVAFKVFKAILKAPPVPSVANLTFNGVHTYFLVDAAGKRQPFRYSWIPRLGASWLSPDQASALPKQYLLNEIRNRLAAGPMIWDLQFQFPAEGDVLDDATVAWSGKGRKLHAGTLAVTDVDADQIKREKLVFDPTGVVPGIELSDDPLLLFRRAVYSESFRRRSQETRQEACPVDMGQ